MKPSLLLILPILALMCLACRTQREPMEYFTDIDSIQLAPAADYLVKIEPSDELIITVSSKNPAATAIYNLPYINPVTATNTQRQSTPDQQTYIVDSHGDINFPVLGKIHVGGLTCEQVEELLTKRISAEVDDPVVQVNLSHFTVVVTGEVMRPNRINIFVPRYTILDALGQAGDLTQYGRRDNVLIIREENGERIHARLDLNSADLLNSPFYFLKQNDYIYVEPNNIRKDNAEYNQFNSYRLSVVSTIVSGCASVISLIIALSR